MKKKKSNFLQNRKAFILVSVLCMGIGFAFLSSNLTITGNTSVSGNKWNVYFTNVQVSEGSVDACVVPTTTGTNTTSLDYTVTLDQPGDFYEFTVDAVNDGTIDAMIQNVNMTTLDTDVEKYLSYTATYLDGTTLAQNNVLASSDSTTYKVRVEFKKNIAASDLSEEGTNLTLTFGVNYVQSTFKPKRFIDLVKDSALSDSNIDFGNISSASNGRGLYVMSNTTEDTNPIYYYRGAVENNNAMFAGYCWKIVRTTETGGTKLIYNGEPKPVRMEKISKQSYLGIINNESFPFSFDEEDNEWTNSSVTNDDESILNFSVKESGNYYLNYKIDSSGGWFWGISAYFYKNGVEIGYYDETLDESEGYILLNDITPTDELSVKYKNSSSEFSLIFNLEKVVGNSPLGCLNSTGYSTQLATKSVFNENSDSPAYSGYMYGNVYEYQLGSTNASDVYGNTFTYSNGTYTLNNTQTGADSTHHYTCFSSSSSCKTISYVYNVRSSSAFYINLTGGKSIEDAISEMNTNTNNSAIKTVVDNWFNNTFKTYFITNSKDYNDYLEDTVWCNDRSTNTIDVDGTEKYTNNGWNANGGSTSNILYYSAYGRWKTGVPSLTCSNKNDSFTVTETDTGNGKLTYPVGLLTADEIMLAGGQAYSVAQENNDFYLYTNKFWWGLSPSNFEPQRSDTFGMASVGSTDGSPTNNKSGVRPSISLKSTVKVAAGGDGTSNNPYIFVVK